MNKNIRDDVAVHRPPLTPRVSVNLFGRLRGEIDRLFDDLSRRGLGRSMRQSGMPDAMRAWLSAATAMPPADFVEQDDHFELSFELADLKPQDINLRLGDNSPSLRTEKEASKDRIEGDVDLSERSYGTIHRQLALPEGIDQNKVSARFEKGVLVVALPKSEAAQAVERKIEVAAA